MFKGSQTKMVDKLKPEIEMSKEELERNKTWWRISEMLDQVIGLLKKENKKYG